jgi:hypothetical protein
VVLVKEVGAPHTPLVHTVVVQAQLTQVVVVVWVPLVLVLVLDPLELLELEPLELEPLELLELLEPLLLAVPPKTQGSTVQVQPLVVLQEHLPVALAQLHDLLATAQLLLRLVESGMNEPLISLTCRLSTATRSPRALMFINDRP